MAFNGLFHRDTLSIGVNLVAAQVIELKARTYRQTRILDHRGFIGQVINTFCASIKVLAARNRKESSHLFILPSTPASSDFRHFIYGLSKTKPVTPFWTAASCGFIHVRQRYLRLIPLLN
ncbi:Uncharacterised protein [Serratia marcescens]|nr:Uncharacterised protein [Serratia marcescens]CVD06586.1 Uncharacterised protein [Serratia marcescens]CVD92800.1 Uncharacterised protein [Serratia marcescens]CVF00024.1 Uncharacterised protein [Serratia marcescens]CVH26046.1 Uncharacterised protein [Serratia marcescens]